MMMGGYGFGFGGLAGLGFWILILVVLILVITWISKIIRVSDTNLEHDLDATEILKQRYARGEIDRQQFKAMLEDIKA